MMKTIFSPVKICQYLQGNKFKLDNNLYCTRNLSWAELLINQDELPDLNILNNLHLAAMILQKYRDNVFDNSPVTITSGWRSANYNKKIGGVSNSFHILGMALDFVVSGFTPYQVQILLDPIHKGGLEFAPTWTHMDIRKETIRFDVKGRKIA